MIKIVRNMKQKQLANVVDTLWAVLVIVGLALKFYFGGF